MAEQQIKQQLTPAPSQMSLRWLRRYKSFFLLGFCLICVQIFLAYKSFDISANTDLISSHINKENDSKRNNNTGKHSYIKDEVESAFIGISVTPIIANVFEHSKNLLDDNNLTAQLDFKSQCKIEAKDAISALQRARTKNCSQFIAEIACAIQFGQFYPQTLPSSCPPGNYTTITGLGCYRDKKDQRLLSGYFTNSKNLTPLSCIQLCLQSGYPYAGVQYGRECFCGYEEPSNTAKLADSSCNMKCSGNAKEICGGYLKINVYATGIAKFKARIAESNAAANIKRVRVAFLLTLNGRALRQVHRLIRALYAPNHFFYIHVDERQDYLYRKLLELEIKFPNIHLARTRFSTIWGGASLLKMLLQCMRDLLKSDWKWDFVINLSESDFPIKTSEELIEFLTANRDKNFVKSHGRETQRFIQKQGLDKTFVECDTHMWRIGDRILPHGIQIDGGSDWVALSRTFISFLIDEMEHNELLKGLLIVFQHTLLPAESFFHTVLRNTHFCDTYIDNNLHMTNWKRKQGCKCQYKHVVDWCGCSPNDFKIEDWSRLQATKSKMLFFARKFEPIINQAILLQLEEWLFGPYTNEYTNLNGYWQSFYHAEDSYHPIDDLLRTVGESIMRTISAQLQVTPMKLHELTHYLQQDDYKGFLVRFSVLKQNGVIITLETRIRPVQYGKLVKNSKFAKRLRNFEVSSDYDQKEQIARNFAKMLGPNTELVLSYTYLGAAQKDIAAHSYNLTLLWIDPLGRLQDFVELHIEETQTDIINYSKCMLKLPMTPGIWTAKLIGRNIIFAQVKFLVTPLAYYKNIAVNETQAVRINGGLSLSLPSDFEIPKEWLQYLTSEAEVQRLEWQSRTNAIQTGINLENWIDKMVSEYFVIREICIYESSYMELNENEALKNLPQCVDTIWSSRAPDPKSNIDALLKH